MDTDTHTDTDIDTDTDANMDADTATDTDTLSGLGCPRRLRKCRRSLQAHLTAVSGVSKKQSGRSLGRLVVVRRRLRTVLGPSWGRLEPT